MMDKKKLRRLLKDKLSLISDSSVDERSFKICERLHQFLIDQNIIQQKKLIGAYAAIEKEPRLDLLFNRQELAGISAFPFFDSKNRKMIFKKATLAELIHNQDFGQAILAPKESAQIVEPEVLIIPGLGFDLSGQRLGRGKGYYDKYLAEFKGLKVGVCFNDQMIESIPTEIHDVPLDYIVTEDKMTKC